MRWQQRLLFFSRKRNNTALPHYREGQKHNNIVNCWLSLGRFDIQFSRKELFSTVSAERALIIYEYSLMGHMCGGGGGGDIVQFEFVLSQQKPEQTTKDKQ